jgi:hypothetical protein
VTKTKGVKKYSKKSNQTILNIVFDIQTQRSDYIVSQNYLSDAEDSECVEEDEEFDYSDMQDNHGAYGFNNFQCGVATDDQKRMVDFLEERGLDVLSTNYQYE